MATTEQQYRVIGKSGPGVEPRVGMWVRYDVRHAPDRIEKVDGDRISFASGDWAYPSGSEGNSWDKGEVEILEAISPPQAAVATCAGWCGLPFGDKRVPPASDHPSMVVESHAVAALCVQNLFVSNCTHPAYCTQACLDRAKVTKPAASTCIRSACKAPPVAGGELCAVKAKRCAWEANGVSACELPRERRRYCSKHMDEYISRLKPNEVFVCPRCQRPSNARDINPVCLGKRCVVREANQAAAAPSAAAETRLERWRREHKGYSHGTADPRVHDANVAAMMVGRDGPRTPYVPPPTPDPWTPRDLDGDIPDAWEPGGARLGGTR